MAQIWKLWSKTRLSVLSSRAERLSPTADLIRSIKDTKSISCTLKDKIASIQKTVEKIDIKPASLDDKKEKEPDPSQAYVKAAKAKAEPGLKTVTSTTVDAIGEMFWSEGLK